MLIVTLPAVAGDFSSAAAGRKESRMSEVHKGWEIYERLVAQLMVRDLHPDYCVTVNASVTGLISRERRQIDVLIDVRHDTDNSRRIIVDAKRQRRKVDITQVESLRALMEDVGATHGYLVCPHGHTEAAEKRAQEFISICLLPLEHLENFDPSRWPACLGRNCTRGRVFWDGFPEVYITAQPVNSSDPSDSTVLPFVHCVGKCDRCGRFHVHCLTCQDLFSLDDDEGDYQCKCALPWFWLASIEHDEQQRKSVELHLVMGTGKVRTVDRRPL
jgi:hypothetical protein